METQKPGRVDGKALCPGCGTWRDFHAGVFETHYRNVAHEVLLVGDTEDLFDREPCEGSGLPVRVCRVCGCDDGDCGECIQATGTPCFWVEDDLCSRCANKAKNEDWLRRNGLFPAEEGVLFEKTEVPLVPYPTLYTPGLDAMMRREMDPTIGPAIDMFKSLDPTWNKEEWERFKKNLDEGRELLGGGEFQNQILGRWNDEAERKRVGAWAECPNCGQWQRPPDGDCMNECAKRGLATAATPTSAASIPVRGGTVTMAAIDDQQDFSMGCMAPQPPEEKPCLHVIQGGKAEYIPGKFEGTIHLQRVSVYAQNVADAFVLPTRCPQCRSTNMGAEGRVGIDGSSQRNFCRDCGWDQSTGKER